MLLDHLVDFCDKEYRKANGEHFCGDCLHPKKCTGSCDECLNEVHFPGKHPGGKTEYDCSNMLNYYVCRYSHKYCSEIEYALNEVENLKELNMYNVMSIGCGASPDLMALEHYKQKNDLNTPIVYSGYDKNRLWQPAHEKIKNYGKDNGIIARFEYVDVIKYFNEYYVSGMNMLFLQYVISYFYNTGQIDTIESFFDDLIDSVVLRKSKRENFIIIINDVNSCYRGRDHFDVLHKKLIENDFHGSVRKRYFDYDISHKLQRYGEPHESNENLYRISTDIKGRYNPAIYCSSAQLIIEVK